MTTRKQQPVVVAGGTGNVGSFIVRALLEQGTVVAVPSRSERKVQELRNYLREHLDAEDFTRLHTFHGTVSDEAEGKEVVDRITREVGAPGAVISLMGSWRSADSLLDAAEEDLDHVLHHYLKAHFGVARAFLPGLLERGGTYLFVNGPLAFEVWPGSALVSIATAAQHMLFKALVKEHEDYPPQIAELVTYAYIRNRQTQPESPLPGEAVGAFAAHLVSDRSTHIDGESIHLQSLEPLKEAGLDITPYEAMRGAPPR